MSTTTSLFAPPASDYPLDPTYAHRRASAVVTVTGADGAPLADADVVVEQTNHAFTFGNIGFELIDYINGYEHGASDPSTQRVGRPGVEGDREYDAAFAEKWLALHNAATLPFYWGRFEPEEGKPRTEEFMRAARWFQERGVELKGHPLVWHTVQPQWLLGKPVEEVERLQRERIRRDVRDFAGVVDTWDAINEVVIMPVFAAEKNGITPLARVKGRVEMIRLAFEEARATNPSVKLLLNDFDMSTAYECLIEAVLEAGIEIDYLGLQSHQHQGYWGLEKTQRILDRFARYNLPIHFTETTLLSGEIMPKHIVDLNDWQVTAEQWPSTPEGEARQADELEEFVRTLVAHPLVEAFTYWGLGDRGMWLNAPGGLLRRDGSAKPAYDRYVGMVKDEWWVKPTTLRTDANGQVTVAGFRGTYRVTAGDVVQDVTLA
ncbi:endo-1,4-beta-xylanase [Xylanimonas protaetiae]|uniref:Beta-xylanase n=1 Tax=Xylanimonas protaetiae TaxID=2509457 RepID=A0A4P6F4F8_9MICO|nr:endo-1,4-beta-xylanase [Xylanimonas protaetiae]QAY70810.1 1,4-beta-xylanase [Xylanimonas protaetiae]